jgi:hypothetical protein
MKIASYKSKAKVGIDFFPFEKKNHKLHIFATFSRTGMCIRICFRQQKDTILKYRTLNLTR